MLGAGFYIMSTIHLVSRTRPSIYKPVEVAAFLGFFVWCALPLQLSSSRHCVLRDVCWNSGQESIMLPCDVHVKRLHITVQQGHASDCHALNAACGDTCEQVLCTGVGAAHLVGAHWLLCCQPCRLQHHPPAGAPMRKGAVCMAVMHLRLRTLRIAYMGPPQACPPAVLLMCPSYQRYLVQSAMPFQGRSQG